MEPNKQNTRVAQPAQQQQLVRSEDLKQLISRLLSSIISGRISPEKARREMHEWYHRMSTEEQIAFKAARNQADETMNYFAGALDTLKQELPALFVA